MSDLSNSLVLLIFGESPERLAHIAHYKRGNERIACLKKKMYKKCTKKYDFSQVFLSESLVFC